MIEMARAHVTDDRVIVTCRENDEVVQRIITRLGGVLVDRVPDAHGHSMLRFVIAN
jgi:predicted acetyltransferase